jgi:hypothetical protein
MYASGDLYGDSRKDRLPLKLLVTDKLTVVQSTVVALD